MQTLSFSARQTSTHSKHYICYFLNIPKLWISHIIYKKHAVKLCILESESIYQFISIYNIEIGPVKFPRISRTCNVNFGIFKKKSKVKCRVFLRELGSVPNPCHSCSAKWLQPTSTEFYSFFETPCILLSLLTETCIARQTYSVNSLQRLTREACNTHCQAVKVKVKVKEVDLYSAFIEIPYTQALRYGSHSVTCKLHRTCLYLVSIHQMAHPQTEVADI